MSRQSCIVFVGLLCIVANSALGAAQNRHEPQIIAAAVVGIEPKNARPIIGVLAQEAYSVRDYFPNEDVFSYIAASYVKFVESGGGRVLPIMIGRDKNYYKDIVSKTNGVLLPGGGVWFNETGGYAEAGQNIYDAALEANARGDFFPVWGTCLGMELLAQASIGGEEVRAHCDSKKVSLPLQFKRDFRASRLFANASDEVIRILATENVTVNSHMFCFTEANFTAYHLDAKWKVLSTNVDTDGLEFISAYEHRRWPFYGIQFHPEKNLFERGTPATTLHTQHAAVTSQYFANFFVDECRRSAHDYEADLRQDLIYKYTPRYSGILGSAYEQVYLFTKQD